MIQDIKNAPKTPFCSKSVDIVQPFCLVCTGFHAVNTFHFTVVGFCEAWPKPATVLSVNFTHKR